MLSFVMLLWLVVMMMSLSNPAMGQTFTVISMPWYPKYTLGLTARFPRITALSNGGGSIAMGLAGGELIGVTNTPQIPIAVVQSNTANVLNLFGVFINWTGAPQQPTFICPSLFGHDNRFLIVTSNNTGVYLLEDKFFNVSNVAPGTPPQYVYRMKLFETVSEQALIQSVLGGFGLTISEAFDLNNDGKSDEFFLGGVSGKLLRARIQYTNDVGATFIPASQSLIDDAMTSAFNNLANTTMETYSKPSVYKYADRDYLVLVGFRSGTTRTYKMSTPFFSTSGPTSIIPPLIPTLAPTRAPTVLAWTLLSTLAADPLSFPYNSTVWPLSVSFNSSGNLFSAPTWVDLNGDNVPDGALISYASGAMRLAFMSYSSTGTGTGCTPPVCGRGSFQLGCACSVCPAGTYKSDASAAWCTACGSPDLYCPEGSSFPRTRDTGFCTAWLPFPTTMNTALTVMSPNYGQDLMYFSNYFNGANVFQLDTSGNAVASSLTSIWTQSALTQEMFGFMRAWRNTQMTCGSLVLDSLYYNGLSGANNTFGFIDQSDVVLPSDTPIDFILINEGNSDLNITFELYDSFYANVASYSSNLAFVSSAVIKGKSNSRFQMRINTGSIPTSLILRNTYNLTLEIKPKQYWAQSAAGVNEIPSSTFLTFRLRFSSATVISVPTELALNMQTDQTQTRVVKVFSVISFSQGLTSSLEFINGGGWLGYDTFGTVLGGTAQCSAQSGPCQPIQPPLSQFSKNVEVYIDTTAMSNGFYAARLKIGTVTIPISLTVSGGPVQWTKSDLKWKLEDGTLVELADDPGFRVDSWPVLRVQARDQRMNPTADYITTADPVLSLFWYWDVDFNGPCPVIAALCEGDSIFSKVGESGEWNVRFQVYAAGMYRIETFDPNDTSIGSSYGYADPIYLNVSAKACTDSNASPSITGAVCKCNAGYGLSDQAFGDAVCELCPKGTFSVDGTSCQPCRRGYYTADVGSTRCIRCNSFLETPDAASSACIACPSSSLVSANDTTWSCTPCGSGQRVRIRRDNAGNALTFQHPDKNLTLSHYTCACEAFSYYNTPTGTCVQCGSGSLTGAFCVDRNELTVLPRYGYWGPVNSNATSSSESLASSRSGRRRLATLNNISYVPTFLKCRRAASCPGIILDDASLGVDSAVLASLNQYISFTNSTCACEAGYTGPLCFKCAAGYTRNGVNTCATCLSRGAVVFLLVLGASCAITIAIYIIRRTLLTLAHDDNDEIILLRIIMSYMQCQALIVGVDLSWPGFILDFFYIMDLVSSTGQSAFSLDCFVDTGAGTETTGCTVFTDGRLRTFFLSSLFIALLPVFAIIVSATFWVTRFAYIKKTTGKGRGRSFFSYFLVSILIILFLLYPSLVKTGFRFFSCSQERIMGMQFLESDFNMICWSTEHLAWALTLGLFMIFGYAVGIPAFFLYILVSRNRGNHRYSYVFAFLFSGYKKKYYYWECVSMVRKLLLAAASILLKPAGADLQAFAMALVIFIFIAFQLHIRPYEKWAMNMLEMFGLVTLYMTLFLGLFQSSANLTFKNQGITLAFGIIIVLVNVLYFFLIGLSLFLITYRTASKHGIMGVLETFMGANPNRGPSSKHFSPEDIGGVVASAAPAVDDVYKNKSREQDRSSVNYGKEDVT